MTKKVILLIITFIITNLSLLPAMTNTIKTNTINTNTIKTNTIKPNIVITNIDGMDPEIFDHWKKTFKYGTGKQKETLIKYIKSKKSLTGENLILQHIAGEKNENIKRMMISTLVTFSNMKVIPRLLELIKKDNSDEMKIYALSQLGKFKYKDSYIYIIENLDSENEILVEAALKALGNMEAKESVDTLLEKLKNEESDRIKTQIILTLANIKSEKTQDKLLSIFTNREEKELNRGYAATGLGYIKNTKSYDILIKYYDEEKSNIKMRIIDALGNLGFKQAIDLLIESLKDDEKNIRIFGIKSLGKLKAVNAIDILKYKEKHDTDIKVRQEARKVLDELMGVN